YKQSLAVNLIEGACDLRNEAREILELQMKKRASDHYPFHVYCTQELAWINHWLTSAKDRKPALEELRIFSKQALAKHANTDRMKDVARQIDFAYLDLAKPEGPSGQFNPVIQ